MRTTDTNPIPNPEVCAPPIPWFDAIHKAAGPAAVVLLVLALACAIASQRLRYNGPHVVATATRIAAIVAAAAGVLCLLARPLTRTC